MLQGFCVIGTVQQVREWGAADDLQVSLTVKVASPGFVGLVELRGSASDVGHDVVRGAAVVCHVIVRGGKAGPYAQVLSVELQDV